MIGCLYTVYYKLESDTSPSPMIYSIIVQSDSMREAVRLCREVSSLGNRNHMRERNNRILSI